MKTPLIFSGSASGPTASATRYAGLVHGQNAGAIWSTTDIQRTPIPIACVASDLHVYAAVPHTSSNQSTLTIMKNAVAQALAATMDAANPHKSNVADTISLSAGDDLSQRFLSGPDSLGVVMSSFLLTASVFGESMIFGGGSGLTSPIYLPFGAHKNGAAEADGVIIIPTAGVISNIFVRESIAPGVGITYTYTLIVNGTPTALTFQLTGTGFVADSVSTGVSINVAQNDLATLKREISGGTPSSAFCRFGAKFVPTIPGESMLFALNTTITVGSDRFTNSNGTGANSATESGTSNIFPFPCVLKKKVMSFQTAPGAAKSRFQTVRKGLVGGAQADTLLSTTIAETNVLATPDNTNEVTISSSDVVTGALVNLKTNNTGAAAAPVNVRDGMVAYIAPAAASGPKGLLGDGLRGLIT